MTRSTMTVRARAALVLVPLVALVAAACSSGSDSTSDSSGGDALTTLVVGMPAEAETLDPTGAGDPATYAVFEAMFDDVLGRDDEGKIVAGLASEWEQVSDTEISLTIRDGVTFHNGDPLTADDVKFSIDHIMDPELAFPDAQRFEAVKDVVVADPTHVTINMKSADGLIYSSLADLRVLPAAYFEKVGRDGFAEAPVGTGPYEFASWDKGVDIKVKKYADYWGGTYKKPASIENVTFRTVTDETARTAGLRSGELQLVVGLPQEDAESPDYESVYSDDGHFYVGFYNSLKQKALEDVRVRQAINYAIDKDALIESLNDGQGVALGGMIAPGQVGYSDSVEPYPYDADKAKSLLAEAGYADGLTLTGSTCTCDSSVWPQAIAGELEKVGITLKLTSKDVAAFNDDWSAKTTGDINFAVIGGPADPGQTYNTFVSKDAFVNMWPIPDATDALIADLGTKLTVEDRDPAILKVNQALREDAAGLYLWSYGKLYGFTDAIDFTPYIGGYVLVSNVTAKG